MLQRISNSPPDASPDADYALVRRILALRLAPKAVPVTVDDLAQHLEMTPSACNALLLRWCGLGTEAFARAVSPAGLRALLTENAPTSVPGGRLPGPVLHHEAIVQETHAARGKGLEIAFGFHPTPFGDTLVLAAQGAIAGLAFVDEDVAQTRQEALDDMMRRWPAARFEEAPQETADLCERAFTPGTWGPEKAIQVVLIGTAFDIRVWEALLTIPMGRAINYIDIARRLGSPTASRAVGSAVGRNPISFLVPCHRVLRTDGGLGGYHWGLTRKRAMLAWETGYCVTASRGDLDTPHVPFSKRYCA